jgi:hypothetical protein
MKRHDFVAFWLAAFILFIFPLVELYPQFVPRQTGTYSDDNGRRLSFSSPNKIEFKYLVSNHGRSIEITKTGTYTINENNGIQYLNIAWNDGMTERYLILVEMNNNFICLYINNFIPYFLGYHQDDYDEGRHYHLTNMRSVSASASLIERNRDYSPTPEGLGLEINKVWAVRGGVNEYLLVELGVQVSTCYISIGYVSFTQPYLYKENSRPKKIRVTEVGNESNFLVIELEDTPHFQLIYLPNIRERAALKIEILEIYPGTKYDDMCINSIMGLFQGN